MDCAIFYKRKKVWEILKEDKEKDKYRVENLIQFEKNGVRVEPLKLWFDCTSSVAWTPQFPPPVLSESTTSPNLEKLVTSNELNISVDQKIRNQSSSILDKTEAPSISPLLKKYLKKDTIDNDTKLTSTKTKWQSSFATSRKMLRKGTKLCETEPSMAKKLNERASCFISPNCRGKWIILASSLIDGCNLEDLWSKLSDKLCKGLFQNCNMTFQTDPDRILIYTNFISSTMVPKVFNSIRKMVRKMSYVVYPYGQVLCWNGGNISIM